LGAAAAAIAGAVVLMPSHSSGGSTAHSAAAAAAVAPAKAAPAASEGSETPRTVPAPRAAITSLLDAFIPAVIARKDLATGWDLVTSDARRSKAEWLKGVTPFQAYAARADHFDGWNVNYSYPGDVGFDVF